MNCNDQKPFTIKKSYKGAYIKYVGGEGGGEGFGNFF